MSSRTALLRLRSPIAAALGFAAMSLGTSAASAVQPGARLFPLSEVRLSDGVFKHAQDVDREYIFKHDPDRLLAAIRATAGLPAKAEAYAGWEKDTPGQTAGHYLSALSQLYAATGDEEVKKRLDYMVSELAECQRAIGDGYVGGIKNGIVAWDQIAAGTLVVNNQFHINGVRVPWYTLHKLFAGLRDAWLVAGNAQARDVLIGLANWCEGLTVNLFDEQMQQMLDVEPGGMNEVLADVSEISGDKKYLLLARRFSHRRLLDPLMAKQDVLTGLHANMQIPKVTGFARVGELADEPAWIDAARFCWENITTRRTVAIGGMGVASYFHSPDDFSKMINMRSGPEACATHNMLRLTEQLYRLKPEPQYVDYYERAIANNILSSQNPATGGLAYHTGVRPRDFRTYSRPGEDFWCCVGTGMQNHTKYGRMIYANGNDGALYVNLFIASELDWQERGLKVRQETPFPDEGRTQLVVSLQAPLRLKVNVRYPAWVAAGALTIAINGQPWPVEAKPSSFVAIDREWRDGDRVEIELPMHTWLERLPDGSPYAAVMRGPIVMSAKVADAEFEAFYAEKGPDAFGTGKFLPIEEGPKLIGSDEQIVAGIKPIEGRPLTFAARDAIRPDSFDDLELIPFFRNHDVRYIIYWPIAKAAE